MNDATSGKGSSAHRAAECFQIAAGTELHHIPDTGSAPALNDVRGGQGEAMWGNLRAVVPDLGAGSIKASAIDGDDTSAILPDRLMFRKPRRRL